MALEYLDCQRSFCDYKKKKKHTTVKLQMGHENMTQSSFKGHNSVAGIS